MNPIQIYTVIHEQIESLFNLINDAYRSNDSNSWTNESKLVGGARISIEMLDALIKQSQNHNSSNCLYSVTTIDSETQNEILIGCIGTSKSENDIEIGTFAVQPNYQNTGMGKKILAALEEMMINTQPDLKLFRIWVLDLRVELIQFYQRRGYSLTGQFEQYPVLAGVGNPLKELKVLEMIKKI